MFPRRVVGVGVADGREHDTPIVAMPQRSTVSKPLGAENVSRSPTRAGSTSGGTPGEGHKGPANEAAMPAGSNELARGPRRGYILNHMVQYSLARLDASFAALSDATRRGVLERLGRGDASITDLAEKFDMTLTGMKKHVSVLETAGLVTSQKVGRVRTCKLGPRRLEDETVWISKYRQMLEERLDHLEAFLERTKGDE